MFVLAVFFDEFTEVCAIGPFAQRNKMACFQWRLIGRNLPTDCFTLAIAKSAELTAEEYKTEELNKVINKVIEDITEPFEITTLAGKKRCQIFIAFFTCDDLACMFFSFFHLIIKA